jgi:hypothetical protein
MIQAFYQATPKRDTPYKQLTLKHDRERGWLVRLSSGVEWGRVMVIPRRGADPTRQFGNLRKKKKRTCDGNGARWSPLW